jgi:hypothetical protein
MPDIRIRPLRCGSIELSREAVFGGRAGTRDEILL